MEPVLAYITKSTLVKDDTDNIARNKLINGPQKAVWNAISGGVGSLPQDPVTRSLKGKEVKGLHNKDPKWVYFQCVCVLVYIESVSTLG